jgi:AcrR family transcriptional regulator
LQTDRRFVNRPRGDGTLDAETGRRTNRNVERGQATRAHLIDVATRLFAAHGYDGTSIEMVLTESGVSRGSLYHHFAGKDALFLAVLENVGARVGAQALKALGDETDPVAALGVGGLTWIRMARDPVVRQIMLIDAPAVLGWHRWRELDEQGPLGQIRVALAYAAEQGRIDPSHVDAFAHIVLAASNEAALMIALADAPAATLTAVENAFSEFLDRLLGPAPRRKRPDR